MKKVDLIKKSIKTGIAAKLHEKIEKYNNRPDKTPEEVRADSMRDISNYYALFKTLNIHKKYVSSLLSIYLKINTIY